MIVIAPALAIKSQAKVLVGCGGRRPEHAGRAVHPRPSGSRAILLHERQLARPWAHGIDLCLHSRLAGLRSSNAREKGQWPEQQGTTRIGQSVSRLVAEKDKLEILGRRHPGLPRTRNISLSAVPVHRWSVRQDANLELDVLAPSTTDAGLVLVGEAKLAASAGEIPLLVVALRHRAADCPALADRRLVSPCGSFASLPPVATRPSSARRK